MVDQEIVLEKSGNIQRCLLRIREITHLNPDTLEDIDVQDIFVLNLQRAVQSAIDLAAHVVAEESFGLPDSLRGHFRLLQEHKVINTDLSNKMQSMIGFRNIAIHEYQKLDLSILKKILTDNIADLEEFYLALLNYYGMNE